MAESNATAFNGGPGIRVVWIARVFLRIRALHRPNLESRLAVLRAHCSLHCDFYVHLLSWFNKSFAGLHREVPWRCRSNFVEYRRLSPLMPTVGRAIGYGEDMLLLVLVIPLKERQLSWSNFHDARRNLLLAVREDLR